jgi:hypothetical protein
MDVLEITSGRKLSDKHIDAANTMLKKQFPHIKGLQSPLLGQGGNFRVTESPFVQILHVRKDHWNVVIAEDQQNVRIFDSSFRSVDTWTITQTASILRTAADSISFCIANTPLQDGAVDCGLFAIVHCTSLVFRVDSSLHFHLKESG